MKKRSPYLVGITGGSASGKTRFLASVRERFDPRQVCIISQDDYYRPFPEQHRDGQGEVNFDLPESIDRGQFGADILQLCAGRTVRKKGYNFNNPAQEPEELVYRPAPVILVEGLFIFYFEEIFKLLDLKIFMEAADGIKLRRRLQRDAEQRGISPEKILYQWEHHVQPSYRKYLLPYREKADMVIINNEHFGNSLQVLQHHLKTVLDIIWTTDLQ